jgi:hypothetical protein
MMTKYLVNLNLDLKYKNMIKTFGQIFKNVKKDLFS